MQLTIPLLTKSFLVSGGGGSIGSELCRQIMKLGPKSLIVFDNSEYNLFCLQQELNEKFSAKKTTHSLSLS